MHVPFDVTTDVLAQWTGLERSGLPGLFVFQLCQTICRQISPRRLLFPHLGILLSGRRNGRASLFSKVSYDFRRAALDLHPAVIAQQG
jgi:hypothetical protein